jgi:hypothetical protein
MVDDLLVSPEWILPGRETKKDIAAWFQKSLYKMYKNLLIWNMLNDITEYDQIESFVQVISVINIVGY